MKRYQTIWFLPLLFLILLLIVLIKPLIHGRQEGSGSYLHSSLLNQQVPALNLPNLFDQTTSLSLLSIMPDKPYLLNIWATWCTTCWQEHRYLNKLARQGINIVGINYKDQPTQARHWLVDNGNPYQLTLYDEQGTTVLDLGIYGAPETFIIDKQKQVRYRYVGEVDEQVWQTLLFPIWQRYQ